MHEKFGDKGLVALTVSTDTADTHEAALNRLKSLKVNLPNYRLTDDAYDTWTERWGTGGGAPLLFVFDSLGRRAAKFNAENEEFTSEDVEKVVKKLVSEGE